MLGKVKRLKEECGQFEGGYQYQDSVFNTNGMSETVGVYYGQE